MQLFSDRDVILLIVLFCKSIFTKIHIPDTWLHHN